MLEEYPNRLAVDLEERRMHAHTWPPDHPPKGFQRASRQADGGMVGNFARGITKTTELVFDFHDASADLAAVRASALAVLDPPVAHAPPAWYRGSGVYGTFATADNRIPALERGLQYKFRYMRFNRDWAPWYGMFDYGDLKTYYRGGGWVQWGNNEPAQDFQWWFNFMRTGSRDDYLQAEAMSRHTMDVDNLHWPRGPVYRGDTNAALDYWRTLEAPEGSPYVGMGGTPSASGPVWSTEKVEAPAVFSSRRVGSPLSHQRPPPSAVRNTGSAPRRYARPSPAEAIMSSGRVMPGSIKRSNSSTISSPWVATSRCCRPSSGVPWSGFPV